MIEQTGLMSYHLFDIQLDVVAHLPLNNGSHFLRTCRYANETLRPAILALRSEWFVDGVVKLTGQFHRAAEGIERTIARYPLDLRFAKLFSRLFASLSNNTRLLNPNAGVHVGPATRKNCLTEVDLAWSDLSDLWLRGLASSKTLKKLFLHHCAKVTDSGITYIAEHCGNTLQEVGLAGSRVTSYAVSQLISLCPELTTLDLSCTDVADDAILPLATGCCPKLSTISLRVCPKITDVSLRAIAEGCKRVTRFSIVGGAITDDGLCAIVEACSDLAVLNLICTSISDNGLLHIATYAKQLKELCLDDCEHVSDGGVKAVLGGCKNLTQISLAGTGVSGEWHAVAEVITRERRQVEALVQDDWDDGVALFGIQEVGGGARQ